MALGDAGGDRDGLARQAAARTEQTDALAEREEEWIFARSRHICSIMLDGRRQTTYRAPSADFTFP